MNSNPPKGKPMKPEPSAGERICNGLELINPAAAKLMAQEIDAAIRERRYSVSELNNLRRAVENKWLFGNYGPDQSMQSRMSRSYREEEKIKAVEEIVRTHMISGHTADDLYASEQSIKSKSDSVTAGKGGDTP